MRMIGIVIPYEFIVDENTKFKDIKISNMIRFNNCNVMGAYNVLELRGFIIYITHPEFKPTKEGCIIIKYLYEEARKKFPYLFVDTNPLLYRKFNTE